MYVYKQIVQLRYLKTGLYISSITHKLWPPEAYQACSKQIKVAGPEIHVVYL